MSVLTTPDGYRLRYAHRNPGNSPVIVLVHGWRGSHRSWDIPFRRFAEQGFEVVAFDNRGMGESDKPVGGDPYDFDVLAGDLRFVLDRLSIRDATLVGWSMGCSISLRYLELGGSSAARLVLVNGPISLIATERMPWGFAEDELRRYLDAVVAVFPRSGPESDDPSHPVASSAPQWACFSTQITLQTPLDVAMRIVAEQAKLDFTDFVSSLAVPTLALYGGRDPYYSPELAHWIARQAPDGRAVVLEEGTHPLHVDEPDRFVDVVAAFARGEL